MPDRILIAEAAQTLQDQSDHDREMLTWVAMQAQDSTEVFARPYGTGRGVVSSSVLLADTLGELYVQLPVGLTRSPRQPADPPGVLEIWYSAAP